MKLTVNRENFYKAIQKVTNIIGSRSTLPVLANVLLEAENGKLTLTTTDLEIRISTKLDANVEREGKTTVPAKRLTALVSKLMGDEISLDCNEKHHTEIICGTSKFRLLGLSDDDFPLPVDFISNKHIKLKENDFRKMLDMIYYAVSLEDTRKVLHGILLSIKDNILTAVATDGKRLALVERVPDEFSGDEGNTIVPSKSVNEVKRMIDGDGVISIEIGEKQATFRDKDTCLVTKLIEGNYPNYRQVIPVSFSKVIDVPAKPLLAKLELVSLALADGNSYVILTFDENKLKFQASSTNVGEGIDYMDIDYEDNKIDLSFNPIYLAEPLKHGDFEKVKIKMNDGFSPVAIEAGEGFLYIIMPMRNR